MKQWNDVPEIEPLSETSWRRIERDLFAELDRNPAQATPAPEAPHWLQRWRRPLIGMGLSLAAAAALLIALRGAPDGAMSQPSRIVTNDAPAALTVGRASIRVAPSSIVSVQSNPAHEVMVTLEAGRVDCRVAHDEHQPPLVVQAGDVRVEVIGTSFAVMRQGSSAAVEVHEGVVKIFHDGRRGLVGAGERWSSGDADRATAAGAVGAATPDSVSGVQAEPAHGVQAEPGATDRAEPAAPDRAEPTPPARPGATARTESRPSRPSAASPASSSAGRSEARESGPAVLPADPKQRYEKAARLEATEPLAAIAIYRELARGKSPWAATALFAQARLELDRGNRREATRLLRDYLQRHPSGNNAADARALLDTTK